MQFTETWWKIEADLYLWLMNMMVGYALLRFVKPFMKKRQTAVYAGAAYFAAMSLLDLIPVVIGNFTAYSMGVLAAFLVMCLTERERYRQKMFIAVTFFSLRWLSLYMIGALFQRIFLRMTYTSYMGGNEWGRFWSLAGMELLKLAFAFGVLQISTGLIVRHYADKGEDMTTREMLMLITPSVEGMTGYWMVKYYQSCIEGGMRAAPSGLYYLVAFWHYGIWIATIVVVTVLFQKIRAKQEEELYDGMLSEQLNSMKRHIGQVENLYQDIRGLKHDMANHILTLEKLYGSDETAAAKEYAKELKAALNHADMDIKSGNPVTDVILREWKEEASKHEIRFRCGFGFPTGSRINAFDVSILLNNALQNAVENTAGEKDGLIEIRSYRNKNAFIIEIRNTFTGQLRWDTENMLPVTSKDKAADPAFGKKHGHGLRNMKRVAEKYMGDIDISAADGEFKLSVMLMME